MFRHITYGQVQMGRWREFYELWEKLDEAMRAKKLATRELWGPTVGTINAFMLTSEYPTIQAFHDHEQDFHGDADCMTVWREMGQLVDSPPEDELWETARQIA